MVAFVSALSIAARPTLTRSSLCGASLANAPAPVRATVRMAEVSEAVPFLPKPKNINSSMIGYAGFDPMAFSDFIDIRWLQEAEIKHGRVCMLAFLGMLVQEFIHLPNPAYANPVATEAFYQVPAGALWQIFLFCGVLELVLHKGKVSYADMFEDGATPGDLGFNPMGLKITDTLRLQEIKNGRLAMCGVGGVIHSMLIYKQPIIGQLLDFKPLPLNL